MTAFQPLDTSRADFPSEADLVHLMCRHIPYIERYWYEDDADHGHFGSLDVAEFQPEGGPINEMVIRSVGQELQGYAALYKSEHFDPAVAGLSRGDLLDRLNRCTRWWAAHHLSGDRRTEPLEWDGQWGDDWESSPWTADLAMRGDGRIGDQLRGCSRKEHADPLEESASGSRLPASECQPPHRPGLRLRSPAGLGRGTQNRIRRRADFNRPHGPSSLSIPWPAGHGSGCRQLLPERGLGRSARGEGRHPGDGHTHPATSLESGVSFKNHLGVHITREVLSDIRDRWE